MPDQSSAATISIQSRIQSTVTQLSPSSARVAQALLEDPQLAMDNTISGLAELCRTSETSVIRFCRSIGFNGYADLRIALAAEVGRERAQLATDPRYGTDIGTEDNLRDTINKIAFAERVGIQETIDNLDLGALDRVIEAIDSADRIVAFGVGASNLVAKDLQAKLMRIGRSVFSFSDAHDAMVMAALLGPDDVAISLSHSGNTVEPVELIKLARGRGATTVGITNSQDCALDEAAELVLHTAVRETTFRSGAMASRTAQLTVVDCIFVSVAQRNFETTVRALQATHEGTWPLKLNEHRTHVNPLSQEESHG